MPDRAGRTTRAGRRPMRSQHRRGRAGVFVVPGCERPCAPQHVVVRRATGAPPLRDSFPELAQIGAHRGSGTSHGHNSHMCHCTGRHPMCPALSDSCLTGGFVPELVAAVRDWRRALTCRNRVVALSWAQRPSPTAKASVADVTNRAVRTDIHVAVGHRRQRPGVACASGLRKNMEPAGLASLLGLVVWLVSASGFG
ncbi:Uncharacterised protein [Mycobacterium tuberculosis]|nr:Uncharacterised protein [Mycobacterium tuberculosis]CKT10976.1 Uncharacterised protein [Mycobacterium tuberculosis]